MLDYEISANESHFEVNVRSGSGVVSGFELFLGECPLPLFVHHPPWAVNLQEFRHEWRISEKITGRAFRGAGDTIEECIFDVRQGKPFRCSFDDSWWWDLVWKYAWLDYCDLSEEY